MSNYQRIQDQELGHVKAQGHQSQGHDDHHGGGHAHYDPLTIPANWEIAEQHARARSTTREKTQYEKKKAGIAVAEVCPCCGYEKDRVEIEWGCSPFELAFIGSGFPMFYTYIKWCIAILFNLFIFEGLPLLIFNLHGNYCNKTFDELAKIAEEGLKAGELEPCGDDFVLQMSIANKLNDKEFPRIMSYFIMTQFVIICIELILFRRHERWTDLMCDQEIISAADFSIIVKNIPKNLDIDYEDKLKSIFRNKSVPDDPKPITVKKIVLIYETEEFEHMEGLVIAVVQEKQKFLRSIGYEDDLSSLNSPYVSGKCDAKQLQGKQFATNNDALHHFDHEIHTIHHKIQHHQEEIVKGKGRVFFAGQAIITFSKEEEKSKVLDANCIAANSWHRFRYWGGWHRQEDIPKSYSVKNKQNYEAIYCKEKNNLFFFDRWLYITEAPEPTDVDWEFINVSTTQKIFARIKANLLHFGLMGISFFIIYMLSKLQSDLIDEAFEHKIEGLSDPKKEAEAEEEFKNAKMICFLVGGLIVTFNKFGLGHLVHKIADKELWSTKTKLNISFGQKLTIALFFNTALITFGVEVITFGNYYQTGGMISSEYTVFILNAIVPPLAWIVDPWSIWQNFKRRRERAKKNSVFTQKEANEIMENQEYAMGKRYADIMKTMWFTFMYSPAIPIASLYSMIGLIIYYWADKYNVIYRRHVKEGVGKELSFEMIELLEMILILHCFGQFWFKLQLFDQVPYTSGALMVGGFIYSFVLDMQKINEIMCPLENRDEEDTYDQVELELDSDYDRENPITKQAAIALWAEKRHNQGLIKSQGAQAYKYGSYSAVNSPSPYGQQYRQGFQ